MKECKRPRQFAHNTQFLAPPYLPYKPPLASPLCPYCTPYLPYKPPLADPDQHIPNALTLSHVPLQVRPSDCNLGKLQRTINTVYIDHNDEYCYAGTASGDVLKVNIRTKLFKHIGPKTRMSQGVVTIEGMPTCPPAELT